MEQQQQQQQDSLEALRQRVLQSRRSRPQGNLQAPSMAQLNSSPQHHDHQQTGTLLVAQQLQSVTDKHTHTTDPPPTLTKPSPALNAASTNNVAVQHQRQASLEEGEIPVAELANATTATSTTQQQQQHPIPPRRPPPAPKNQNKANRRYFAHDDPNHMAAPTSAAMDDDFGALLHSYTASKSALANIAPNMNINHKTKPANPTNADGNMNNDSVFASDHVNSVNNLNGNATVAGEPRAFPTHTPFQHQDTMYAPMMFPFVPDPMFLPPEAWQQYAPVFPPAEPQQRPSDLPPPMDSKEHSERVHALVQELRMLGVRQVDLENSGIDPAIQAMVLQGQPRPPPPPPPPPPQHPPPPPPPPVMGAKDITDPNPQNDLLVISLKSSKPLPPKQANVPPPESTTSSAMTPTTSKQAGDSPVAVPSNTQATAQISSISHLSTPSSASIQSHPPPQPLSAPHNGALETTRQQVTDVGDPETGEEDMDLEDDDEQGPTILAGTWKTVQPQTPAVTTPAPTTTKAPEPQTQARYQRDVFSNNYTGNNSNFNSHNRSIPSRPTNVTMKSTIHMDPNRFPGAMAALSQVPVQRSLGSSQLPTSRLIRRNNPLSLVRGGKQTPFVKERNQSFVIDLDDDGDESDDSDSDSNDEGQDRPQSAPPSSNTKAAPSSMKDKSLEELQAKLKVLNELIRAKELARMASPSTTPVDSPNAQESMEEQNNNMENSSSISNTDVESGGTGAEQALQGALLDQNRKLATLRQSAAAISTDLLNVTHELEQATSEWIQNEGRVQTLELRSSAAYERFKEKEREMEKARQEWQQAMNEYGTAKSQLKTSLNRKTILKTRMDELEARNKDTKDSISHLQKEIAANRGRLQQLQSSTQSSATTTTPTAVSRDPVATGDASESSEQNRQDSPSDMSVSSDELSAVTTEASSDAMASASAKRSVSATDIDTPASTDATQKRQRLEADRMTERMLLIERMNTLKKEKKLLESAATLNAPQNSSSPRVNIPATTHTPALPNPPKQQTNAAPSLPALDKFLDQVKTMPTPSPSKAQDTKAPPSRAHLWRTTPSIRKLFTIDQYTVDLDRLCLPSDLIEYPLPESGSRSVVDFLSNSQSQSSRTANGSISASDSNADTPKARPKGYESPLKMFKSYRFSTDFTRTVKDGFRSLTYSNKIDPNKKMCLFELAGGACNDDNCESLHLRDCTLTDDELIVDLAKYTEGKDPISRQKFVQKETANLTQLRAQGIHNADVLAGYIVDMHRKTVGNPYETIKFGERIEKESESNPSKDPPSVIDRLLRESDNHEDVTNLEQYPILLKAIADELIATATDKPIKAAPKRYYEAEKPTKWYEEKLVENGKNVSLWIEYALVALRTALEKAPPNFLTPEDAPPKLYHEPLSILSLGLALNPESEALWSFNLELATLQGSEDEVRELFGQAIEYVPSSRLIWWRYFLWEKNRDQKAFVLDRMLENACGNRKPGIMTEEESQFTVDVVLQIVKLLSGAGLVETAKNWMQVFLSSPEWEGIHPSSLSLAQPDGIWCDDGHEMPDVATTFAAKILLPKDLCVLWLAYIHLIWNHELPSRLFLLPPCDYLSDSSLFTIHWLNVDDVEDDNELHHIVSEIFLGLVLYFMDLEDKPCIVAILKNYVDFMLARHQSAESILEVVNPSKFTAAFAEIHDIASYVHLQLMDMDEALKSLQSAVKPIQNPFGWNRLVQLSKSDKAKQECLIQCALSYFEVNRESLEASNSVAYGVLLYKKLLGLDLPAGFSAPKPASDISTCPQSAMLWINYLCLLAIQCKSSNSFVELEKAYVFAIASLPEAMRGIIREDYAVHTLLQNLDQVSKQLQFSRVMANALESIPVSQRHPYDRALAKSQQMISPVNNPFYLNRVVEKILKRLVDGDVNLRIDLLSAFLRQFPQDPDLYLWMGEAQEEAGNAQQCRNIVILMTRRFSINEDLWRITNQLFVTPASAESHDLMSKASMFSSWAARVVQAPLLFAREMSATEQTPTAVNGDCSPTTAPMILD
ncbi:Zinc finger C3H1 domain-containing protein [Actinomortierella wolfii]|nr:Zinc finger C3H1 domain-containing protein [Actinomortierella wolfii]